MYYTITEKKLVSVIFNYLDNQKFINAKRIPDLNDIYFVNSDDGIKEVQIIYRPSEKECLIYFGLVSNIMSFFSLEKLKVEEIIGGWVEQKLQMKVSRTNLLANIEVNPKYYIFSNEI